MKKILFVVCLLSTSAAFAQYANHLSSEPQIYQTPDHPAHASYAAGLDERGIVGGGGSTYAQGDRPAWDFPQAAPVPLGDSARELKKQHALLLKKSRYVWIN
jgi:hypothetical protein